MTTNKFLRRKGRWKDGEAKYVIEEMIEGKSKYHETVPMVEHLLKLIRQDKLETNQSQKEPLTEQEVPQKFPQSLLNESQEQQKIRTVSEEERRMLAEISK